MEAYKIEDLNFAYPAAEPVLKNIDLEIKNGDFILLFGRSGSGKTTLLRQLKPVLAPAGQKSGTIYCLGREISALTLREESEKIGYLMQDVEAQIVTDKVWHELAFGLESLGYDKQAIRLRVAEIANFFGIESWFHKKTTELSGGQKQLLNLASIMTMQPEILILDEPTSQLDPIMAVSFLETLQKINNELGVTIVLSEHRLEEVFAFADKVVLMDNGEIIYDDRADKIAGFFYNTSHPLAVAMPTAIKLYSAFSGSGDCPVDLKSGRKWLERKTAGMALETDIVSKQKNQGLLQSLFPKKEKDLALELEEIYFRYQKDAPDVLQCLNFSVKKESWQAIVGGNGAGKTSLLKVLAGLEKPYRGKRKVFDKHLEQYKEDELFGKLIALLPQNPQTLFTAKTLALDLEELLKQTKVAKDYWQEEIDRVLALTELLDFKERHPYDLSGGEQQRAALAKILLLKPKILLLDEPTKCLDGFYKIKLAEIIRKLIADGTTVVMVSHDIEFCAKNADYCSFLFDGEIVSKGDTRTFFSGNAFYTTAANRLCRKIFPKAILTEDIINQLKKLK